MKLIMIAGAAIPLTYATWNPADKDADVSLSAGDLQAESLNNLGAVRSTIGLSATGHWRFQITVQSGFNFIGVAPIGAPVNNGYPGETTGSYGYFGESGSNGTYTNNVFSAYGIAFANLDVVDVEVNNGVLTFWVNGSSQGTAYSGLSGTLYAFWGVGSPSAGLLRGTANFGATAFTHSVPGAGPLAV